MLIGHESLETALHRFIRYCKRLSRYGQTISLSFKNGKIEINKQTYKDKISQTEIHFKNLKNISLKKYFTEALVSAKSFTGIKITDPERNQLFIIIDTGEDHFQFRYIMEPKFENSRYGNEFLAILLAHDFIKSGDIYDMRKECTYSIIYGDDATAIAAECGKNLNLTVEIIQEIIKYIFVTKKYPTIQFA